MPKGNPGGYGKGKGRKPRKPKAWALALLLGLALLPGCGLLDKITGADDPEVITGVEPPKTDRLVEEIEDILPAPWGWIVGAGVGAAGAAYVRVRRKQKGTAES